MAIQRTMNASGYGWTSLPFTSQFRGLFRHSNTLGVSSMNASSISACLVSWLICSVVLAAEIGSETTQTNGLPAGETGAVIPSIPLAILGNTDTPTKVFEELRDVKELLAKQNEVFQLLAERIESRVSHLERRVSDLDRRILDSVPLSKLSEPEHKILPSKDSTGTIIQISLSVALLLFGVFLLVMQHLLIRKNIARWDSTAILRFNIIPLVIFAGLFLIVAGYSQMQIASMMGLLGTIAGYLLGKEVHGPGEGTPPTQPGTGG